MNQNTIKSWINGNGAPFLPSCIATDILDLSYSTIVINLDQPDMISVNLDEWVKIQVMTKSEEETWRTIRTDALNQQRNLSWTKIKNYYFSEVNINFLMCKWLPLGKSVFWILGLFHYKTIDKEGMIIFYKSTLALSLSCVLVKGIIQHTNR